MCVSVCMRVRVRMRVRACARACVRAWGKVTNKKAGWGFQSYHIGYIASGFQLLTYLHKHVLCVLDCHIHLICVSTP